MRIRTRQRKSAVLILALLLMGAIIGSGIALSTVIVESSRQSQTLNDFIAASLAADSGIERGLATVKVGRQNGTIDTTLTDIGKPGAENTSIPQATVSSVSPSTTALGWSVVRPNESVSFDIGNSTTNTTLQKYTIIISGQAVAGTYVNSSGASTPLPGRFLLDVSWVGLNASGEPYYSGKTIVPATLITAGAGYSLDLLSAAYLYDITGQRRLVNLLLNETEGFRVRIRPVDQADYTTALTTNLTELAKLNVDVDSVKQLRVSGTANFPSRIEITSRGKVSNSQSQKSASVLWQLPSSPAFGYVLFTEGDIIPK